MADETDPRPLARIRRRADAKAVEPDERTYFHVRGAAVLRLDALVAHVLRDHPAAFRVSFEEALGMALELAEKASGKGGGR